MTTKNEIRNQMTRLLDNGMEKEAVFDRLSGQGVSDRKLARWLASIPEPGQRERQSLNIGILTGFMALQTAILLLFVGAGAGMWMLAILFGLIPLAFAWGFRKPSAFAYGAYVALGFATLPRHVTGVVALDAGAIIAFILSMGLVLFVLYVQRAIFPGLFVLWPLKINGRYVFALPSKAERQPQPTPVPPTHRERG